MSLRRMAGTALAETAIVLSFTLLVLFGTIQIALVGFFQTQLDGATFMYSHAYALGSTDTAALDTALSPVFPSIPLTTWGASNVIAAHPLDTDLTTLPNFTQWGTLTERFGGASLIRDQLIQTQGSMRVSGLSVLGNSIALSAGNVDGKAMVGNHDDDAQGAGYNSSTVWGTLVDPLNQDDQNVPPYYFALAFMGYCTEFQFGSSCPSSDWTPISLGLAEYLKDDPTGNAGNYNTASDGIGSNSTFQTMACHQRIYADLAAAFPATMPSPNPASGSDWDEQNGPMSVSAWNGASFRLVYSWDIRGVHGGGGSRIGMQYPLHPNQGCSSGQPGG